MRARRYPKARAGTRRRLTRSQSCKTPLASTSKPLDNSASHILGDISDYLDGFADGTQRILHVEPVFRPDLVDKFQRRQKQIKQELMQLPEELLRSHCVNQTDFESEVAQASVEDMSEYPSRPMGTFHGADESAVSSIVRYGFAMPGHAIGNSGEKLRSRYFNAAYGLGIYSTPDLDFAMVFAGRNCCFPNIQWRSGADFPRSRILENRANSSICCGACCILLLAAKRCSFDGGVTMLCNAVRGWAGVMCDGAY